MTKQSPEVLAEARAYVKCMRVAEKWDRNPTQRRQLDRSVRDAHTAWNAAKEALRSAQVLRLEADLAGTN